MTLFVSLFPYKEDQYLTPPFPYQYSVSGDQYSVSGDMFNYRIKFTFN